MADTECQTATDPLGEEAPRVPRHAIAERSAWVWLPVAHQGLAARHPWCRDCGEVKHVGSARALDIGGLTNLIARFERLLGEHGRRLTEAQRRLVVNRLRELQADDTFGLSRDAQMKILADTLARYLHLPTDVVGTYLRSC